MSSDDANFEAQLLSLLLGDRKIEAIKLYRERTGASLVEAKEAVEALDQPQTSKQPPDAKLEQEVILLLEEGKKIEAIKLYRDRTGAGLKEAKDAVGTIATERNIVIPSKAGCLGVVLLLVAVVLACFR